MPVSRPAQALLFVSLAAGAWLRWAFHDEGIFWPDEVYQSFEPAHALVFGHGLIPWEFIEGARNWALPGFVALLLKLCAWFGASAPTQYIAVVKAAFVLISSGTAWGTYRLARASGAGELEAAAASSLFSFAGPVLYFAPRAMSENACALPIVWGLAMLLDEMRLRQLSHAEAAERKRARGSVILGASLLGLAVLLRLQSALFCLGVLGLFAARRQWLAFRWVVGVLGVWAIAFGALDAFSWHDAPNAKWGGWFHSAVVYVRFNLIEGKAAGWGVAPWYFFVHRFWTSMPVIACILALSVVRALRPAAPLVGLSLLFLIVHSATPHKEYRFVLPALPGLFALVAVAVSTLSIERLRQAAVLLVLGAGLHSSAMAFSLTFGQLGQYPGRDAESAWDDNGPINRLMLVASQQADLCGLYTPVHPAWMGGATYLHTKAPLYAPGWPSDCVQQGTCNYAIVPKGTPLAVVAEDKGFILGRIPNSPCRRDESYSWRLP